MLVIVHSPIDTPSTSAKRRSKDAGVKLRMKTKSDSLEKQMLAMKRMVAEYSAFGHLSY